MLEPTMTTSTDTHATTAPPHCDSSKPIEILNSEQMASLSAYASAESSPTNDYRLVDEPCFPKADAAPLNTYWGLPPATSLLIDEEDKLDALEHSREKLSMSKSFNNTKGN